MSQSHAMFTPEQVIENCDLSISLIYKYRDADWEYAIARQMLRGPKSWTGKQKGYWSREEAMILLKHYKSYSPYRKVLNILTSIKKLAKKKLNDENETTRMVMITCEDINCLFFHEDLREEVEKLKQDTKKLKEKRDSGMLSLVA